MKKFKILLAVTIGLYLSACLYLYVFQSSLLYFPTPEIKHTFKIEEYINKDVTIKVIVLNPDKTDAVIYFGGNGESVAKTVKSYKNILSQHTVYFVNYRGYGGSTGTPQERGIYSDAQFVFDQIAARHKNISVIGRSLGTGVATFLASTRPLHKMILITPYDSIKNVAKEKYPLFPIDLLLLEKYDSAGRIKNIQEDTLIILAEFDTLISYERSRQLIKKFPPAQVTTKIIKNSNHRTLSHHKRYYLLIKNFL